MLRSDYVTELLRASKLNSDVDASFVFLKSSMVENSSRNDFSTIVRGVYCDTTIVQTIYPFI